MAAHESGLTCIHQPQGTDGLCPECQRDYALDPLAYYEFGDHPDGLARWDQLRGEIQADLEDEIPELKDEIPFRDIPF